MKIQKRYYLTPLIFCILTLLCLSGCQKSKVKSKNEAVINVSLKDTKEYYVETDIDLPGSQQYESCLNMFISSDGKTIVVTRYQDENNQEQYKIYTKQENEWISEDASWMIAPKEGYNLRLCRKVSDTWYLLYRGEDITDCLLYQYEENKKKLDDITPKEWYSEKNVTEANKNITIYAMEINSEQKVLYYVSDLNELHSYNPKTGENVVLFEDDINSFTLFQDDVYYISDTNRVKVYDHNKKT